MSNPEKGPSEEPSDEEGQGTALSPAEQSELDLLQGFKQRNMDLPSDAAEIARLEEKQPEN